MVFNAKEVKKHLQVKNFYLYIINHIKSYQKLPSELDVGISKQNISYYTKALKTQGVIRKLGYGVWSLDEDKAGLFMAYSSPKTSKKTLKGTKDKKTEQMFKSAKNIRGHSFQFIVEIPKRYDTKLIQKEVKKHLHFKMIRNDKIISTKIKGHTIWFCNKTLVIYFNKEESIFGENAIDCYKEAIYQLKSIITHIGSVLRIDLTDKGKLHFNLSKSHYGKINDALAKEFNKNNDKLSLFSYKDGKQWCLIDNSFNLNELESVHPVSSISDMDNVIKPLLNGAKEFYDKTGESYNPQLVFNSINSLADSSLNTQRQVQEIATGLNNIVKIMNLANNKPEVKEEILDKPYYVG